MNSPIFILSLQAGTLEMILRIPLIKQIGLKSPSLALIFLGTNEIYILLKRERSRLPLS